MVTQSRHDTAAQGAPADLPLVIRRKLVAPPMPSQLAPRPRLERQILRLLARHRVILMTAAAGSGKTTAVATATLQTKRPVAWLTVDHPDQAPGRLLTYLEASLAEHAPDVMGIATRALASGISHAEAAGLLVEALGHRAESLVVVLDELERLGDQPEAWAVVEALLRYAPTGTSFLLISRQDLPSRLCQLPSPDAVAVVSDADLAFTPAEAELALMTAGRRHLEATAVVEATSGWVTGVLFESWRAESGHASEGADTDLLYDYLSSQILDQLTASERQFLVSTSLLDEVTVPRAGALGISGAATRMDSLATRHLPVVWTGAGAMRCHTYFREYLQSRLALEDEDVVRALRVAYGRRLADEGHDEEATEELLLAGALEDARHAAERCIVGVVERLDLSVAERWLEALSPDGPPVSSPGLLAAALLLAITREQIVRGVELADQISAAIDLTDVAAVSERAALLMAWCYLHVGRLDAIDELLESVGAGPASEAMRFARDALFGDGTDGVPVAPNPPPSGPLGAIVCNAQFALGRLKDITDAQRTGWNQAFERPWQTAALRARGRTEPALGLFEEESSRGTTTPAMKIFAGPDVLMDAYRWDEARSLLREASAIAMETGSLAFRGYCSVLSAKLELRGSNDPAAARAVLGDLACRQAAERIPFIGEIADTWEGLALLMQNENAAAIAPLRRAVEGMAAAERLLELPTACIYLAEALWRTGDEAAADVAAERALVAAVRQGSNHLLLRALGDFPAVATRRISLAGESEDPWQTLATAMLLQGRNVEFSSRPALHLSEFGRRAITVAGAEVRPRIAKSYELLAYLIAHAGEGLIPRDELLGALFDGRNDESARAYLRQSLHQLREILPEGAIHVQTGHVGLGEPGSVVSDSVLMEQRLAEAVRLQGTDRLAATLAALEIWDRGPYLPGPRGEWVEQRERRLGDVTLEARYQAAVLAYGAGDYRAARDLLDAVLAADEFREAAWRLQMRVAEALGNGDAVLRTYADCERVLSEVGAKPTLTTRELLRRLRR